MLPKISILTLFLVSALELTLSVPTSPRSAEEDAVAAFEEYTNFTNDVFSNYSEAIRDIELRQTAILIGMEANTLVLLDEKLDQLEEKINQIEENLKMVGDTDQCSNYDVVISNFREKLRNRTKSCISLTTTTIGNLIQEALADLSAQKDSILTCYGRILKECQSFVTDEECYVYFKDVLDNSRERVVRDAELIKANIASRMIGLTLPCQNLIEFEISVYPNYLLQRVSSCADLDFRLGRPDVCPYSFLKKN